MNGKNLIYKTREHSYHKCESGEEPFFTIDETKILNNEGDNVSEMGFRQIIKDRIIEYIYPFENIVLLAGAGASIVSDTSGMPDENYGHTIRMLSEAIFKELKPGADTYSIQEISSICKYIVPIEVDAKYNPDFNLEDFLSRVLMYENFLEDGDNKEKYIHTKELILRKIKEKTSYDYNPKIHKHGSLIQALSGMHKSPNRLTIVTTNYDTLFEDAANDLIFTTFDGFSFDSKNVFDPDWFDWSLVKPITNVKSERIEYKKSTINLLKIHGSLTWKKIDDIIVRIPKSDNDYPIMIFPSSDKYLHSYEKPYFELFSKFQELIKRPNSLLITVGFSFTDNHIAKMITQAIKTSPSLSVLITDHSIDSNDKCENWKELERLMEERYRIAFLKATVDGDLADYFGDYNNYDNR